MSKFLRVPIEGLRNHPLNASVFGELDPKRSDDDKGFAESVAEHGVLEPIILAEIKKGHRVIISGHRRRQAAARAGFKDIPALVHDIDDPLEIDREWFEANRQREMTTEHRARWYMKRKEIESAAAEKRMKLGKSGQVDPRANLPRGRTNDIAAEDAGMSRRTAEAAAEVVREIDAAESNGDTTRANDLRDTLNSGSVSAASRKVTGNGKPEAVVDAAKLEVPKHLLPAWEGVSVIRGLLSRLGSIRKEIEQFSEEPGAEFLPHRNTLKAIAQAQNDLRFAQMHTRCPHCKKLGRTDCKVCKGAGFVCKDVFRRLSDVERGKLGLE